MNAKNWICTKCGAENAPDEEFCLGCGIKPIGAAAMSSGATTAAADPTPPPTPGGTVVRTLMFRDKRIPLVPGRFTIASDTVPADLGLPGTDISSTGFVLEIGIDGSVTASYNAVEPKAWAVIKDVEPAEQVKLKPGDRILAGERTLLMLV